MIHLPLNKWLIEIVKKPNHWKKWLTSRVAIIIPLEKIEHEKLEFSSMTSIRENKKLMKWMWKITYASIIKVNLNLTHFQKTNSVNYKLVSLINAKSLTYSLHIKTSYIHIKNIKHNNQGWLDNEWHDKPKSQLE